MKTIQRQSLLLVAPQKVVWVNESLPPVGANEVLAQTLKGAISVGTELPLYRGTHRSSIPIAYPKMTGYESLARVVECGRAVQTVKEGDIIVSFYGHRTYAVLKETKLIPVPAHISERLALLSILGCDVTKGMTKLNVQPKERTLITGAGTIGLLTLFNLKARGVEAVDVVEPNPQRRELAAQLGASKVAGLEEMIEPGQIYKVGFECSSQNEAFRLLQGQMVQGGRLCILADGNLEPLVLSPHFHERELQVIGSSDGEDYQGYARWLFDQNSAMQVVLERLYELEVSADQLSQVFEQLAGMKLPPLKVIVHYS